jgi:hypothetical protein
MNEATFLLTFPDQHGPLLALQLGQLCRAVGSACRSENLAALTEAVLIPASDEVGICSSRDNLAAACSRAVEEISSVIDDEQEAGERNPWGFGE